MNLNLILRRASRCRGAPNCAAALGHLTCFDSVRHATDKVLGDASDAKGALAKLSKACTSADDLRTLIQGLDLIDRGVSSVQGPLQWQAAQAVDASARAEASERLTKLTELSTDLLVQPAAALSKVLQSNPGLLLSLSREYRSAAERLAAAAPSSDSSASSRSAAAVADANACRRLQTPPPEGTSPTAYMLGALRDAAAARQSYASTFGSSLDVPLPPSLSPSTSSTQPTTFLDLSTRHSALRSARAAFQFVGSVGRSVRPFAELELAGLAKSNVVEDVDVPSLIATALVQLRADPYGAIYDLGFYLPLGRVLAALTHFMRSVFGVRLVAEAVGADVKGRLGEGVLCYSVYSDDEGLQGYVDAVMEGGLRAAGVGGGERASPFSVGCGAPSSKVWSAPTEGRGGSGVYLGTLVLDVEAREGKSGIGAYTLQSGCRSLAGSGAADVLGKVGAVGPGVGGGRPVVVVSASIDTPEEGMLPSAATALFHEVGHAIAELSSMTTLHQLSGARGTGADAFEVLPQIFETASRSSALLRTFACNAAGERPTPQLLAEANKMYTHYAALKTSMDAAWAAFDLGLHSLGVGGSEAGGASDPSMAGDNGDAVSHTPSSSSPTLAAGGVGDATFSSPVVLPVPHTEAAAAYNVPSVMLQSVDPLGVYVAAMDRYAGVVGTEKGFVTEFPTPAFTNVQYAGSQYAYLFASACARQLWLSHFSTFQYCPPYCSEARGVPSADDMGDYMYSTRTLLPPGAALLRHLTATGGVVHASDRLSHVTGLPAEHLAELSGVYDECFGV